MRKKSTLVSIILFTIFSFWLGEGELQIWSNFSVVFGAAGALVITLIFPGKAWQKALIFLVMLSLYILCFFAGTFSSNRAFNECVGRGEEVRIKLSEYHQQFGQYPDSLQQLPAFSLCSRILRPSLLVYQKTNGGYMLSFKDWLVEHSATETYPFMGHK